MKLTIRALIIFLLFSINAFAFISNKEYKHLTNELKEIKRVVKILEKRSRPPKPKKIKKTIETMYENKAGYEFDCQNVIGKQTKKDVIPSYSVVCIHTPVFKLKSAYGQEISFLGKSFSANSNLKQTLSLKEEHDLKVDSFISLSYLEPYTVGLGVSAQKSFNKNKHKVELLVAQYSFLTRAKDSGEFFRDYDLKYIYHYTKRTAIALRTFVRQKAYSKSRLYDTYSMRFYAGMMYYMGAKYNYVFELSPFFERIYNPKAVEDGYEVDYKALRQKDPTQEEPDSIELGGYSNSFGIHGSFTYRW